MKLDIRAQLPRIDWQHLRHASAVPCAILFGVALIVATVFGKETYKRSAAQKEITERVLYIGDSLSVGTFGELISDYLVKNYGRPNVAFYASCGSSPENWLSGEPVFETKCGYRQMTPSQPLIYGDPMRHRTPKIEALLREHKPTIVMVQQGTNWMDRSLSDDNIRNTLDRFIDAIHSNANCKIYWIAPPDSSRFRNVEGRIYKLIQQHHRRGDYVIPSHRITHYVRGKTGGDGVHYSSEAATQWAQKVIPIFDSIMPKPGRKIVDAERIIQSLDSGPELDAN